MRLLTGMLLATLPLFPLAPQAAEEKPAAPAAAATIPKTQSEPEKAAPAPKTMQGTIATVDAANRKVSLKIRNRRQELLLAPDAVLEKQEKGLTAGQLQPGDQISYFSIRRKLHFTGQVQSQNPLTVLLEGLGTLILQTPGTMTLTRHTPLTLDKLTPGTTIVVDIDGVKDGLPLVKELKVMVRATGPEK